MTMPHSSVFDAALHAVVLHQISFMHVLSNWLLMMSTCPDLEIKYGAWRVAVLWLISCLGGGACELHVGDQLPGHRRSQRWGVGIMGLFVADMFINFKTIRRPILRCIIILIIFVFSAMEMSVRSLRSRRLLYIPIPNLYMHGSVN